MADSFTERRISATANQRDREVRKRSHWTGLKSTNQHIRMKKQRSFPILPKKLRNRFLFILRSFQVLKSRSLFLRQQGAFLSVTSLSRYDVIGVTSRGCLHFGFPLEPPSKSIHFFGLSPSKQEKWKQKINCRRQQKNKSGLLMKSMRDLQQKLAERFFLPNAMER